MSGGFGRRSSADLAGGGEMREGAAARAEGDRRRSRGPPFNGAGEGGGVGTGAEEAGGGTASMAAAVGVREPESRRRSGTRGARLAGPAQSARKFF